MPISVPKFQIILQSTQIHGFHLGKSFSLFSVLLRTFISVVNRVLLLVVTSEIALRKPLGVAQSIHLNVCNIISQLIFHRPTTLRTDASEKLSTCIILVLKNTG